MNADTPSTGAPNRRIALLIDADNISHGKVALMLAELSKYGTANIRRAYGDWGSDQLKGWKTKLQDFAIRPMQQFSYTSGKNATDMALVIDAMELLYTQKLDAFCIASSDADFTPLIMQLKANGHDVYGFGERKTPSAFVNACTTFLYLDGVGENVVRAPAEKPKPKAKAEAKQKPDAKAVPAEAAMLKPVPILPTPPLKSIAEDTQLAAILRGAVEATAWDDGWASLAAAGSAAKRQAPIDPRNYGVRNFPALFEATGLFEIFKAEGGQGYVADKSNTDRTKRPAT